MSSFADLNLCPELQFTLAERGYDTPTPIQTHAIPLILQGCDLLAEAQTGTGKTAAFALPIIERLSRTPVMSDYHPVRALVLAPTRELAIQVSEQMLAYGERLNMRVIAVYGGVRFDNQIRKMKRGADILVATPGRLLDMVQQKKLSLDQVECLVLDEADRMLDLGFAAAMQALFSYLPTQRQTLLFSATCNAQIDQLAEQTLSQPQRISTGVRNASASAIRQRAFAVDQADKSDILAYLIHGCRWSQTLVFTRTKKRADLVTAHLVAEGISAAALHGDKPQRERNTALAAFKDGKVRVLVATDVAARGLDIAALPQVVNYDLPNQPEAYVHRIGRTGRAGQAGLAISLVSTEERRFLLAIGELMGQALKLESVPLIEQGKLLQGRTLDSQKKRGKNQPKQRVVKHTSSHKSASRAAAATPGKESATKETDGSKGDNHSSRDKARRASLFG